MTGEDTSFDLYDAVERLLKSSLYLTRLKRVLINGYDPKVLIDFLVMDDIYLVFKVTPGLLSTTPQNLREKAFAKALKSAESREDVRSHDQIRKLGRYLRDSRPPGVAADWVFDQVYGPPKKIRAF